VVTLRGSAAAAAANFSKEGRMSSRVWDGAPLEMRASRAARAAEKSLAMGSKLKVKLYF
jgi:hypothetical protein